ncbi:transposase (plasmid) [Sinorhizobium americanum CCGM7]|nr:transposase [Sinorhizobium americanum CCGM7]
MFRRIDQWGNIDRRALTPQSINFPEGPLPAGRPRPGALFGAWLAVGLTHRGGQPRHPAS